MQQAETVLVIFLSAFLAIFLALAIVLVVKCIQITNQIKRLTDKAENLVNNAESATEMLKAAGGSLAVGKILTRIFGGLVKGKGR